MHRPLRRLERGCEPDEIARSVAGRLRSSRQREQQADACTQRRQSKTCLARTHEQAPDKRVRCRPVKIERAYLSACVAPRSPWVQLLPDAGPLRGVGTWPHRHEDDAVRYPRPLMLDGHRLESTRNRLSDACSARKTQIVHDLSLREYRAAHLLLHRNIAIRLIASAWRPVAATAPACFMGVADGPTRHDEHMSRRQVWHARSSICRFERHQGKDCRQAFVRAPDSRTLADLRPHIERSIRNSPEDRI